MKLTALALYGCLAACGTGDDPPSADASDTGTGNAADDCLTDSEEVELGTDPKVVDSDGDDVSDCDELACGSGPTDDLERCYACGSQHNDPGNLVSTPSWRTLASDESPPLVM